MEIREIQILRIQIDKKENEKLKLFNFKNIKNNEIIFNNENIKKYVQVRNIENIIDYYNFNSIEKYNNHEKITFEIKCIVKI